MATAFVDAQFERARPLDPAAPEMPRAATAAPRVLNRIGGGAVRTAAGRTFASLNPATGETLAEVEIAGETEVDHAVAAAKAGQAVWGAMTGAERGRILQRAADLLRSRNEELARLETLDTGKPIQETIAVDVLSGADCLDYFAGLAATLTGEHVDLGPNAFGYTRREPLGVVAGIGAWNYPLQIACWKAAPALACGNAMIFKPAELTPLTAIRLADIMTEAGLPDGVFNVVQGFADTGRLLTAHPDIAKVSLTGEVGTGKAVMADAGAHAEARHARTRRQVAADRLRRRRSRRCRLGRAARQFLFGRRGLLERHPRLRRSARVRAAFLEQPRRPRREDGRRRSRSIRRPRSAR